MIVIKDKTFYKISNQLRAGLLQAPKVKTEKWQGLDISKRPEMATRELLNVIIEYSLNSTSLDYYRFNVAPNLPWADDHFLERMCGEPLNPGVQWANWPWASSADKFRIGEGKTFNHTYMQRYWGKPINGGGDMMDLVRLLAQEPHTRQAWIPIFWPQDTGVADGGRKPCSLGYQIIMRDGRANIYYPLRSCDFIRHFPDDVYLTIRLLLWVMGKCADLNPVWRTIKPGVLLMHMTSLHIFENDYIQMMQQEQESVASS